MSGNIRTLILTSDKVVHNTLKYYFSTLLGEVELVGCINKISKANDFLKNNQVDLIFAQVKIGKDSVFTLLSKIQKNKNKAPGPLVVLMHEDSALAYQAIKLGVFDYITLPIVRQDVINVIARIHSSIITGVLGGNTFTLKNISSKVGIVNKTGMQLLDPTSIQRCEAISNQTIFYLNSGNSFKAAKSLVVFERLLSSYGFERFNRSQLINTNQIAQIRGYNMILNDGTEVPVNMRYRQKYKQLMERIEVAN